MFFQTESMNHCLTPEQMSHILTQTQTRVRVVSQRVPKQSIKHQSSKALKLLSPNQTRYSELIHTSINSGGSSCNSGIIIGVGCSGSGKTTIPVTIAAEKLMANKISKIIITRPNITVDESHGYLPGSIEQKMLPFLKPIYDCFLEFMTMDKMKSYLKSETIEICPFSYIRGRTFSDSFILADETQNTTISQMKTLLTRIGENSTIVLTGDLTQSDLCNGQNGQNGRSSTCKANGLSDILQRIEKQFETSDESCISVVEFTEEDIVRSELVKKIVKLYEM